MVTGVQRENLCQHDRVTGATETNRNRHDLVTGATETNRNRHDMVMGVQRERESLPPRHGDRSHRTNW